MIEGEYISWSLIEQITDETIVYDGRKEEKMSKKYKVTQTFADELKNWQIFYALYGAKGSPYAFVDGQDIQKIPDIVGIWWTEPDNAIERNNRLIAIIKWLNGEDAFEIEEPHKFVVRSYKTDEFDKYSYVLVRGEVTSTRAYIPNATKFDTREEAQEWANSHQVVVEIDAEGNEVE